ncbi:MAG: AAA family ATPase, partial [Vallitaleaceae bacterium]|nr:AAA family ATPase [Vallitaleaceae bacterium]
MKITRMVISNFQSIDVMTLEDIENTLILVGKNNVGKSSVLNAFKLLCGFMKADEVDFYKKNKPIEIQVTLRIYENEINNLYRKRKVSEHRKFEKWYEELKQRLPSFDGQRLSFGMKVYPNGDYRYYDGVNRNNPYIEEVLPSISLVSESRNIDFLNNKLIDIHGFEGIHAVMENTCIFDPSRKCSNCFDCIGYINKKSPIELSLQETFKLVNYRLYSTNLKKYADSINRFFQKTYGNSSLEISYQFDFDMESLLKVHTMVKNTNLDTQMPISDATTSMRSLYILSLFQAYIDIEGSMEDLILIELPELHLHPEMQKITSEILYRLSKKNQVIYTTHSPYMLYNFNNRQIQQITVDAQSHDTILGPALDLDDILDDLGYSANDMIGADFVFIVEGKDDRSRLPLLLENYYSELQNEDGEINRIAIIPTNSCTNIKTYANLKFINKS